MLVLRIGYHKYEHIGFLLMFLNLRYAIKVL
jgi:hypothetical protein